MINSRK